MAALMLTILPVIIFYALMQKHILKGVMEGPLRLNPNTMEKTGVDDQQ